MGTVIEHGDSDDGLVVEGGRPGAMSMQQFQHVYALMTGKSEEINKTSNLPIMLELDDLFQLDKKVWQMLEQYQVVGKNSSYSVYFDNGEKSVHSSYEKFAQVVGASSLHTESVYFRYRISVLLPQVNKPQNYTISIRCINRLVMRRKVVRDLPPGAPPFVVNMIAAKTVDVKVEYVDFSVARAVIAATDEWISSLHKGEESSVLKFVRSYSHYIPPICQYVGLASLSWGYFSLIPRLMVGVQGFADFSSYLLAISLSVFLTWKFLGYLGGKVEEKVDATCDLSYLQITRGDRKDVEVAKAVASGVVKKAIIGGVFSGLAGVGVKFVAALVFALH